jgi:integrase
MSRYLETEHPQIKLHSANKTFYFRGTVQGRFHERSLKTKSFKLAKDRAQKIIAAAMGVDGFHLDTKKRYRFGEAFDLVLKIQSTKHESTYQQAKFIIDGHLRHWFEKNCPFIDRMERHYEEVWAEYQLDQKSKKERKLAHDRRYLVMTLKRASNKGWLKKIFTKKDFELNEAYEPVGKYLADEEIARLLTAASKYPRLYLQVMMAVYMGMRISEILHLRKDEIDLGKREINLDPNRLKIRRPREVPIPIAEDVFSLLKIAYDEAPGDYLFPAWYTNIQGQPIDPNEPQDDNRHHWKKVREAAKLQLRFHDLRHTAITNMLKAGMPEVAVRKIVGASEPTIRRVYAHIETEMRDQFRNVFRGKFVKKVQNHENTR